MSTQTLDPTLYTKKGTLRKRKPKTKRDYFGPEVDQAIVDWQNETDKVKKDEIYRKHIHNAVVKLTENLIHTYKYYYTDHQSIEQVQQETVIFIYERLHKYDPQYGKAYSYYGTIAKRYLIFSNIQNYKKLQTHQDVQETSSEEDVTSKELIYNQFEENQLSHFLDVFVTYNETYMIKLYPKEKERQIADAVLELFRKRENLDIFNKKAFYIFIKEMIDADTTMITKVIKKMKVLYAELYNQYTRDGVVQKLQ